MLLRRAAGEVREHTLTPKLSHYPHRMRSVTRPVLYRISISRLTLQVWLSSTCAARGLNISADGGLGYAQLTSQTSLFPSTILMQGSSCWFSFAPIRPEQVLKHIYLQTGHREAAAA